MEAEQTLLKAITRHLLLKTLQARKGFAGAVVIYEFWRLVVAL
jgi:hypothetical protein